METYHCNIHLSLKKMLNRALFGFLSDVVVGSYRWRFEGSQMLKYDDHRQ